MLSIVYYRTLKKQFMDDVRDATVLQITPSVISRSVMLLEGNVSRALDSMHVACAFKWQADLFVTSDRRHVMAATNAGLRTEYIGQPDTSAEG